MYLNYRGIAYAYSHPQVETIETGAEAQFLGTAYKLRQHRMPQGRSQPQTLIFRGCRYTR